MKRTGKAVTLLDSVDLSNRINIASTILSDSPSQSRHFKKEV